MRTPQRYLLSRHAGMRLAERGYGLADIDFLVEFGVVRSDAGGRSVYSLPQSPFASLGGDPRFSHLQGLVVVLAPDGRTIVTVYERDGRFRFGSDL